MNRDALLDEIELEEGYKAGLYIDTENLLTFAIGRCLERKPLTAAEWRTLYDSGWLTVNITHEGARYLEGIEADAVINALSSTLRGWQGLPYDAQAVLISMAYQLGIGGLLGFHNALAAAERHDWHTMAAEIRNSKLAKQTPARTERHAKRIEGLANA